MLTRLIRVFGLLIGAAWMGEVLFGNLGDTALFGNFRTYHLQAYRAIGWSFIGSAVGFTVLAGLMAAYRTGGFRKAVLASALSGLVSGVIVLTGVMAMEVFFHRALRQSPSVLSDFARSGQRDLSMYMYGEAFVGGIAHVLIGPALGVTVGAIGAAIGMLVRRLRFSMAAIS